MVVDKSWGKSDAWPAVYTQEWNDTVAKFEHTVGGNAVVIDGNMQSIASMT